MATRITGALQQEGSEEKNKVIGLEGKTNKHTQKHHTSVVRRVTPKRENKHGGLSKKKLVTCCGHLLPSP